MPDTPEGPHWLSRHATPPRDAVTIPVDAIVETDEFHNSQGELQLRITIRKIMPARRLAFAVTKLGMVPYQEPRQSATMTDEEAMERELSNIPITE